MFKIILGVSCFLFNFLWKKVEEGINYKLWNDKSGGKGGIGVVLGGLVVGNLWLF